MKPRHAAGRVPPPPLWLPHDKCLARPPCAALRGCTVLPCLALYPAALLTCRIPWPLLQYAAVCCNAVVVFMCCCAELMPHHPPRSSTL